jgi:thiol-disulfide isomerase/thioredoxin
MKRIYITGYLLLCFLFGLAQKKENGDHSLTIGDKVPDLTFRNVLNYPGGIVKLSDLKGKLVILDFWNKWCTSCIDYFPKMEKLQAEFGDKIQILLVTDNTPEELKDLFKNSEIVKNTKLPFLLGDTALHARFFYTSVPYHVWLDEKGVVKATTNASNATSENIKRYFETGKADFKIRKDVRLKDESFLTGSPYIDRIDHYSLIMRRLLTTESCAGGILKNNVGQKIGYQSINGTILQAYCLAFSPGFFPISSVRDKIILETASKNRFIDPQVNSGTWDKWCEENTICYEIKYPSHIIGQSIEIQQQYKKEVLKHDLIQHFKITAVVEERNVKNYILYRTSKLDKVKSREKDRDSEFVWTKEGKWVIRNWSFLGFVNQIGVLLGYKYGVDHTPIINETGFESERIDMVINTKLDDIPNLNKELAKYDLAIKEEVRLTKCLIIKDLN